MWTRAITGRAGARARADRDPVSPLSQDVAMHNDTRWFDGLMLMLGRAVVPPVIQPGAAAAKPVQADMG